MIHRAMNRQGFHARERSRWLCQAIVRLRHQVAHETQKEIAEAVAMTAPMTESGSDPVVVYIDGEAQEALLWFRDLIEQKGAELPRDWMIRIISMAIIDGVARSDLRKTG